jgi:two-component system, LytTR family, response regulator
LQISKKKYGTGIANLRQNRFMIMNTLIIDDDIKSRKLLNRMLQKFPGINVIGEAENISSALKIINEKDPQTLFLDVCLKNENGFDLIPQLTTKPKIVFISNYDEYAIKAFEVDALDYLQKPLSEERLALTLEKLLRGNKNTVKESLFIEVEEKEPNNNILEADEETDEPEEIGRYKNQKILEYDDRVFFTSDGISKFIKINSIISITAEKDYTFVHTLEGKKHLLLKPMVEWEARLTSKYFVRIHRSTIINMEFIERMEKWFNYSYLVHMHGISEPYTMSRRYAAKLKETFK